MKKNCAWPLLINGLFMILNTNEQTISLIYFQVMMWSFLFYIYLLWTHSNIEWQKRWLARGSKCKGSVVHSPGSVGSLVSSGMNCRHLKSTSLKYWYVEEFHQKFLMGSMIKHNKCLSILVFKRTFCSAEQFGHFQAELFCSAEPNIYLKSSALAEHPKILYF